jgi:stage II sporulation protein D
MSSFPPPDRGIYQVGPIVCFPATNWTHLTLMPTFTRMRLVRAAVALAAVALGAPAVANAASTFFIRGGGDGHGIGMSQYGAEGYAQHGKSYKFILAHYYRGTALGHTDPGQVVRVLLATGSAGFSGATRAAGKRLDPSLTYTVSGLPNGELGVFNGAGKRVARAAAPLIATGPGPLSVAGLGAYRGSLEFRPDGSGGVETVEAVGLDDYVRGVISGEVPSSWAPEALKTQAVAARTYAITTDVGGADYNLYPDTRSQMYGGVGAETPSTDAAVAATRGQVVTYNGAPVVTYFFNSSGGHTENIENVWPGATPEPWLRGVPDPYDGAAGDPYHRWGSQMTTAAAAAKLGAFVKGSLVGIRITKHGASPRILTAQVVGTRGRVNVTGLQLQQVFGLLTTYASFTTVSSATFVPSARGVRAALQVPGGARLVAAVALVPVVAGDVVPARAGAAFTLQVQRGSGWRTYGHYTLGAGGRYSITLPSRGVYRVMYRGLAGPPVTAG